MLSKSVLRALRLMGLMLVVISAFTVFAQDTVTLNVIGLTVPPEETGTPLDISRQDFIAGFQEANPTIAINAIDAPPEFDTQIIIDLAAGTAPDVWYQGSGNLPNLVAAEGILDVSVCLELVPELTLDRFSPNFLAIHQQGDALWGLPDGGTPMVMYYNPEAFAKAGVAEPSMDWTWDEFLTTMQEMTLDSEGRNRLDPEFDEENIVQYGFRVRQYLFEWIYWVWQNGGDVISPDGTTVDGYLNSPESIEAITFLRDLVLEYGVAPSPSALDQLNQQYGFLTAFLQGDVAMFPRGHWEMVGLRNNEIYTPERVSIIANPRNVEGATVIYESGWVISAALADQPERLQAACTLLEGLTDVEFQSSKVISGLEISANVEAAAAAVEVSEYPEISERFVVALADGRPDYSTRFAGWAVLVEEPINLMMENILAGADIEEEVAITVEEVDRELERANR
jgi:multiple sugar transport system substrate-binding protein